MAEEKKEEKQEQKQEVKKDEAKVEAVQAKEAAAPAASQPAAAPAPAAPAAEPAKTKKEKPSNCTGCNKSIKKKRWYYRDGKYYCTKRCWKSAVKKDEKAPEEAGKEQK